MFESHGSRFGAPFRAVWVPPKPPRAARVQSRSFLNNLSTVRVKRTRSRPQRRRRIGTTESTREQDVPRSRPQRRRHIGTTEASTRGQNVTRSCPQRHRRIGTTEASTRGQNVPRSRSDDKFKTVCDASFAHEVASGDPHGPTDFIMKQYDFFTQTR